jgi:PAS domain S-box-containing protein
MTAKKSTAKRKPSNTIREQTELVPHKPSAEQIEAERERYFRLYDLAPVGYVTLDRLGSILESNLTTTRMLGVERRDLLKVNLSDFVSREFQEAWSSHWRAAFTSEAKRPCEIKMRRADHSALWIRVESVVSGSEDDFSRLVALIDVTESKNAEEALRESEQRFRHVADHAPVMIWISGIDALCTWVNNPWLKFTGRTLEQELGNGWAESIHPDDLERCLHDYATSFEARQPCTLEYRLRRNDGEWRWLFDAGVPMYKEDGVFVGYMGSCIDVTDRRQSEAMLRERESQLKAEVAALSVLNEASSRLWRAHDLQEGLNEMLISSTQLVGTDMGNVQILDADGHLIIAAHCGFKQDFLDFFRQESIEGSSVCAKALHLGRRVIIEDIELDPEYAPFRAIARSAGYRAVQSTPLPGRDGKPIGMLTTHFRSPHRPNEQDLRRLDLYARQAADFIERNRIDEALRDNEGRMRSILKTASDAIITIDRNGIIHSANTATERLFGYTHGQLIGEDVSILIAEPYDGERAGSDSGHEVVAVRRDGSTFPVDLSMSEVEDLGLFTAIIRDTSARKKAQQELDQYKRDLRIMSSELMLAEQRERHRLAQDLHDGLGQALFRAQVKLDRLAMTAPAAKDVGVIIQEIGKMVNTLTFELSPPVLRQLGFRAAIKWLTKDVKERYGLTVDVDDDGQEIALDERVTLVLFRSMRELLINVAKHAQLNRATMSLRRMDGNKLQVEVKDDGKGFDLAQQFHHVESGHFGLFSVRERLEYLGGTFKLRSAPGKGTTATLIVPLAAAHGEGV